MRIYVPYELISGRLIDSSRPVGFEAHIFLWVAAMTKQQEEDYHDWEPRVMNCEYRSLLFLSHFLQAFPLFHP